ncbi:MAG: HAD hydrolase-like protein, partial [Rhodospirillales bacterium]|nr:HAD hydrolase-like protein [Rhodospirillales bacterium]
MWLDRYDALLCDLDGCLIAGDRVLPGARELAAYAGERLWIISNNSTDTPHTLSGRLAGLGLHIAAERIMLAGATAIEQLAAEEPGTGICIYGSDAIKELARAAGLQLDADRPDIVLLTRDERFDYDQLNRAVRQLEGGARLVVANGDPTHPGADGHPVAETGALLAALLACRPGTPYREVGKPSPAMYRAVLARLGLEAASILAIGDNPATDGEGAQ